MTHHRMLAGAAVLALGVGAAQAVVAQERIGVRPPASPVQTITGQRIVTDELADIELRTQRELAQAEDQARFGTAAVQPGFRGSLSATGNWTRGRPETIDFALGGRFTLGQGAINHSFGTTIEYGESAGERDRQRILGIYDVTYDLTPQLYIFGLGRGQYDEFANNFDRDFFVGAGPGFRIINTQELAWRVQAGPGYRYTRSVETGDTNDDLAGILSSRAFIGVTPDIFVTNDTDVLHSDADTLVSNELAVNTRLAGPLSGRVGLRTDYTTDPVPGQRSTDNALTFGIVYSFQ
ncbi:DUF481 domain-containing protein [soil metagenome]